MPPSNGSPNGTQNSAGIPEPPQLDPATTLRNRLAASIPGLGIAAHAIGLENIRGVFADARQRTRDGHKAMAGAAGFDVGKGGDDVGDLIVTGDIHTHQQQSAPEKKAGLLSKSLPWIAALGLGGGVAGGGIYLAAQAIQALSKPAEQQPATNTTIQKREGFLIELAPQPKP